MNILTIFVLIIVVVAFYNFNKKKQHENFPQEKMTIEKKNNKKIKNKRNKNIKAVKSKDKSKIDKSKMNAIIDKIMKTDDPYNSVPYFKYQQKDTCNDNEVNPYFKEEQFHQDYRDTINACTMMTDQKSIFNKCEAPLIKTDEPKHEEINNIAVKFVRELNRTVRDKVDNFAAQGLNSWQDNMPPVNAKSEKAWEVYNKELGLPTSIYPDPAKKAPIKIVKIDNIHKEETDNEIRYSVYLILQKVNVKDQMFIRVNFVMKKDDIDLEREFFDSSKNNYETNIIIEEITTLGFMIKKGAGRSKTAREKLYDFKGFEDGRLIPEKDVIRQLNNKKREIQENYRSY